MSFTDKTLLSASLSEEQIAALEGTDEAALDEAIAQADARITAACGISPQETASDNHRVLISIANRLVIWTITGRQSQISDEELDRRRRDHEDALKDLDLVADGSLAVTAAEPTGASSGSEPRRMVDY